MFCAQCGHELTQSAHYCGRCSAPVRKAVAPPAAQVGRKDAIELLRAFPNSAYAELCRRFGFDKDAVTREFFHLELLAYDFAVATVFGQGSPVRARLSEAFFQQIGSEYGESCIHEFGTRSVLYAAAINEPHELGVQYSIGRQCGAFIQPVPDAALTAFAAEVFHETITARIRFLRSLSFSDS